MQTTKVLPQQAVEEFKRLYKVKFKQDLTENEAIKRANNLFGLYQAVYGFSKNKPKAR